MWGIVLQRNGGVPMARQLYQALRGRMTDGLLKPGEALPSTREMARQLGISRNTACEAYAMLQDEGFVESRPGAPTRVAAGLALRRAAPSGPEIPLRRLGVRFAADFRTGKPDLRLFPAYLWRQMLRKGAEALAADDLDYGYMEGLPALREEIARWLLRGRGLDERPQDIFVTAGTTQVLALLPSLPALRGGTILLEDPCHTDIMQAWMQM
jgi:GntR family transcriptional regulator/MocR family aminotransferase